MQRRSKQETAEGTAQKRLLREREAAAFLGTTPGTLRADRHSPGMAIPFVRLGRAIRYDIRALESLIAERTVQPEPASAVGGA